jgi:hypothetical protein
MVKGQDGEVNEILIKGEEPKKKKKKKKDPVDMIKELVGEISVKDPEDGIPKDVQEEVEKLEK